MSRRMTDTETVDLVTTISEDGSEVVVPMPVHRATSDVMRQEALRDALARAGTLVLTREEQDALAAPFNASVEEINPINKARYISHMHVRRRLDAVLGVGQWAIVRLREWVDQATGTCYGSYCMIVRGVWVGDTVTGESPKSKLNDYGDAWEGGSACAVRRIAAKALGCGGQVWDKRQADKQQPYQQPPAAPQQPPQQPANGKPAKEPVPSPEAVMEAFRAAKSVALTFGTAALAAHWDRIGKPMRIALQSERAVLKQMASVTDREIAARGSIDE
jgi:hypothetical protein